MEGKHGPKLTKAQLVLLDRCSRGHQAVRPHSSPVMALRRAGFVEFDDQAGRGLWWLTITPAGREALAKASA